MAELSLSCPTTTVFAGGGGGTAVADVDGRRLIRNGGVFAANTVLDINSPGAGWLISGQEVTFSGSTDFVNTTQVYRNGQLLLTAADPADDLDVYFVAVSGTLAFESDIQDLDVLQIWKFSDVEGDSGAADSETTALFDTFRQS